ncbi:HEAT repeat domain-containing protein [Sanguibacter suaedae]|uniref:HEAT repeat domain-containing protein n=1 Tax=Sanguibacter suaedae TaxID=2795737 RepID=A0A934I6E0_9MICO|nr:HEAT repeat domain-containing protein [Sanguibacter suaedae]MBI9115081.1 HEAT repeat domain-containing protein [Sanguibacter suaedae]
MLVLSWTVLVWTLTVLCALCVALLLATVAVRVGRGVLARRREALVAQVRPLVLEVLTAEDDEVAPACEKVAAVPEPLWPTAERYVLAAFDSVRGEVRDALVQVLLDRGTLARAVAATTARSAVRRARAAEVVGLVGHVDGRRSIVRLLSDPSVEVRTVAARALGQLGDPHVAALLLGALRPGSDVPASIVGTALIGIGEADTTALEPALEGALADRDEIVRLTAVAVAAELLVLPTARYVGERVLHDPSPAVRVQAARALARLGGAWAVPTLASATAPTEDPGVRLAAARTLLDMGTPTALDHLAPLRDDLDPDLRRLALEAGPTLTTEGAGP